MPSGKWKLVDPNKVRVGDLFLWKEDKAKPTKVTDSVRVWMMLNPETYKRIVVRWDNLRDEFAFDAPADFFEGNPEPNYRIWVWEWDRS